MSTSKATVENHLSETEPRWFAIRTRYKSEKLAYQQLEKNNIHAYLPLRESIKIYHRKKRVTDLPLINSFVFVKIIKREYIYVLQTEYVSGFLKFGQNLLAIPEEQINLIRRLLGENLDIDIEPSDKVFEKGDWVEVTTGPLLGLRGQLIMVKGKEKVLVELINSGYTLQISIDNQLLKKIPPKN
jgi:transcription antitermination factor NusG